MSNATNETPATGDRCARCGVVLTNSWHVSRTLRDLGGEMKRCLECGAKHEAGRAAFVAACKVATGDDEPQGDAPATGQGDDMLLVHDPAEALKALATPEGVAALSLAAKDATIRELREAGVTQKRLLKEAMEWFESGNFRTPQSCGGCGTPNGNCDMDCVAASAWGQFFAALRAAGGGA